MSKHTSLVCDFCGETVIRDGVLDERRKLGSIIFPGKLLSDHGIHFYCWSRKTMLICPSCLHKLRKMNEEKEEA